MVRRTPPPSGEGMDDTIPLSRAKQELERQEAAKEHRRERLGALREMDKKKAVLFGVLQLVALGLLVVAAMWNVQTNSLLRERDEERKAQMTLYKQAETEASIAAEDAARMPSAGEVARWLGQARELGQRVADSQNVLVEATGPLDPFTVPVDPMPTSNAPPGSPSDSAGWVAQARQIRAAKVEETKRALFTMVSVADRDDDGFDASGHWHKLVKGLPEDVSYLSWKSGGGLVVEQDLTVKMDWMLVDADQTAVAVVTGRYSPKMRVMTGLELHTVEEAR